MIRKTLLCLGILFILGFISLMVTDCSRQRVGGRFQIAPLVVQETSNLPDEALIIPYISDTLQTILLPSKPNGYKYVSREELATFYEGRNYRPAWFNADEDYHELSQLDAEIIAAAKEAIDTNYYKLIIHHFRALADSSQTRPEEKLALIDIGTSYLYLTLAKHLILGQYDYLGANRDWHEEEGALYLAFLRGEREKGLHEAIRALKPQTRQYRELRDAYEKWSMLGDSGWHPIAIPGKMAMGDSDAVVSDVKERLHQLGYQPSNNRSDYFDTATAKALALFQKDHGLIGDSVIGEGTLWALNLLPSERAAIIGTNLDRLRWGPQTYGNDYFLVNIPEFMLHYYEDGKPEFDMAVVVGKTYHKTPVFSDSMEYIVFNPTWSVPPGISRNEILPALQKDPGYARRENMVVYEGHGPNARQVDPAKVKWDKVSREGLNYKFVQRAGNYNALGRVKFIFPNSKNVYLHDTPSQYLFSRESRAFSHGCIRVSQPEFMAWYLLKDTLSREEVSDLMNGPPRGLRMPLPKKIPVHIVYQTAAVRDGRLQIFRDLYGYDAHCQARAEELRCRMY